MEWKENRADEVLKQYARHARKQEVQVRFRSGLSGGVADVPAGGGMFAVSRAAAYRVVLRKVVAIAAAACVVLGLFVLLQQPQKIYGYVNDVPLTSKEEARAQARQMFDDLAVGMAPAEDVLGSLFSL